MFAATVVLLLAALVILIATERLASTLKRIAITMSADFDRLTAAVSSLATVGAGVKTTVDHMVEQLRAAADAPTPEQINALADRLEASRDEIAANIVAGTAASGEPPTEDPVAVPVEEPAAVA